MRILVTGCAGFIGSHLCDHLLKLGYRIIGIDNFNDYYDPKIKEENLNKAFKLSKFKLYRIDILDFDKVSRIFKKEKPEKIIHLAARAGVRPSIINPRLYTQVNVLGTVNLLKLAVDFNVKQFIFGSSSSVYGQSKRLPFTEDDPCDDIISPYGSSKRATEFFIESFCKSYHLKSTILRFFTVYGPRGRPDMAPALFAKAILSGKSINQFGDGLSSRDYTYIDDIIDGIIRTLGKNFSFEIINLGNNHPVRLTEFITILEKIIDKKAKVKKIPMQTGDVETTWANVVKAKELLDWRPKIRLEKGLAQYLEWLTKLD